MLTSSLASSLLGDPPQELETDCLLQQIQSLKQANLLLHTELEQQQRETEEIICEKDNCIHKLQQKVLYSLLLVTLLTSVQSDRRYQEHELRRPESDGG